MKSLFTYLTIIIVLTTACSNTKPNKNLVENKRSRENQDAIDWSDQLTCLDNLENYEYDTNQWEHIKLEFYRRKKTGQTYMLTCVLGHGPDWDSLPFNIDFDTYQDFGRYSTDKNFVYYRVFMSDGNMILKLDTADRKTFTALGTSTYAKDSNHVYRRGDIIENADPKTFNVLDFDAGPPLGRDKNNVYVWGEILKDTTEIEGLKEWLQTKN